MQITKSQVLFYFLYFFVCVSEKLAQFNQSQPVKVSSDALQAVVKLGNLGAASDPDALTTLNTLLNWPAGSPMYYFGFC